MATEMTPNQSESDRAIVGVFDDRMAAERAVDTLHQAGFHHEQIGFVIRGADDVRGGMITDAEGTKDGKGALTGLGISEEEARFYEKEFHSGRAIVAVKPRGRWQEAADVLVRSGGQHVHAELHSPIRTDGMFSTP